ncbi:late competence development ComFB family protein [Natroniella sulfidigena]|uniref:late competence development ComFB family protein n=1 Tax=Natroniella sulfidigena TaxID=723921 RepID=UPI00200B9377|nr:late competence development ComFB family protein [Natroniella sulfidigena]MCK8817225.1 late competence development ComFB family protein [Natroniella sulfidigena]
MNNEIFNKIQQEKLHNHTEDVVLDKLEKLLTEKEFENICTCEQCLFDMASYALNTLPAKYITTAKGDVMTRLDEFEEQSQIDFDLKVIQAIQTISKNPSHA